MIKTRINNEYKDIIKIFGGGTLQKEIIKVWSREAQEYVYESSVEYAGTLPIAINANGDMLLDYRIYGADGGVGEPTESGEPAGYKLPMIVNNGITNIVPPTPAETKTSNGITVTSDGNGTYTISGTATKYTSFRFNFPVSISCGSKHTAALFNDFATSGMTLFFNEQSGVFGLGTLNRVMYNVFSIANRNLTGIVFNVSSGTTINGTISPLIFDGVNITPTEFVPHIPSVSYDVPVYIGDPQLEAGEYVSYSDEKIYRMVDGTLTPTDPPVSFPNIPTIEGETVIDYDGEPKPSQMYIKYRR